MLRFCIPNLTLAVRWLRTHIQKEQRSVLFFAASELGGCIIEVVFQHVRHITHAENGRQPKKPHTPMCEPKISFHICRRSSLGLAIPDFLRSWYLRPIIGCPGQGHSWRACAVVIASLAPIRWKTIGTCLVSRWVKTSRQQFTSMRSRASSALKIARLFRSRPVDEPRNGPPEHGCWRVKVGHRHARPSLLTPQRARRRVHELCHDFLRS